MLLSVIESLCFSSAEPPLSRLSGQCQNKNVWSVSEGKLLAAMMMQIRKYSCTSYDFEAKKSCPIKHRMHAFHANRCFGLDQSQDTDLCCVCVCKRDRLEVYLC